MTSTIEDTLKHVLVMARYLNSSDPQSAAIAVLIDLGIATKSPGFAYLKDAIVLFLDDPIQLVTKGIYPAIGECYQSKPSAKQVEIAIRRAITDAWECRNERTWAYYFKPDRNGKIKKPTNAEFISMIAYFLELWKGCSKGVSRYERG